MGPAARSTGGPSENKKTCPKEHKNEPEKKACDKAPERPEEPSEDT